MTSDLPLRGRRVLVTRPAAQSAALAGMIAALGGEAVCFPLLDIGPIDVATEGADDKHVLASYDFAVFISPNAVDYGLPRVLGDGWPAATRAVAIGPSTVAALAAHGIGPVLAPSGRFDSEAVLALPEFSAAAVAGRRVLILRGNGGRELLAETLRARGATVDCLSCYRRSAPADMSPLVALLRNGGVDAVTLSSSEGLRNLWSALTPDDRQRLVHLPVFVPHARIAEEAAALGLQRVLATAPADAGLVAALTAFDGF
ncbi:uroporphyrinogen-III synthase [Propionivibrio dicarboxylicus]|uniref:Uroporphyrinogen-III synthase n=1 Tax=Propionivibrio dicarboxylicus TaxID=83767 RepID=A0A1G8MFB2_9RHOO|nr:uroporphyrinogen-III synthase [Propionivibrio dicarboxylicus]SDI66525.1 uroporphyrinogen-III synthase [Propionivibrio dicarboxylicus]